MGALKEKALAGAEEQTPDVSVETSDTGAASTVPHVYTAILEVMHDMTVTGIGKNKRATGGGVSYTFRGIDDVYAALAPALYRHKLVIIPRMVERTVVERATRAGGAAFFVSVRSEYLFVSCVDGSTVVGAMFGEAQDTSDKATAKAESVAYKQLAFQTFCIPVEGQEDEGDGIDVLPQERLPAPSTRTAEPSAQQGARQAPQDSGPQGQGQKSSHQAKKDGDYIYLTRQMDLQRTEAELRTWAKDAKNIELLNRQPKNHRDEINAYFLDRLKTLRKEAAERAERERAERELDRGFDAKNAQWAEDLDGDDIPF